MYLHIIVYFRYTYTHTHKFVARPTTNTYRSTVECSSKSPKDDYCAAECMVERELDGFPAVVTILGVTSKLYVDVFLT